MEKFIANSNITAGFSPNLSEVLYFALAVPIRKYIGQQAFAFLPGFPLSFENSS
jgi:hypothetical protein